MGTPGTGPDSGPPWVLVSMYSDAFAPRAEVLVRSCRAHGIAHEVVRIEPAEYRRTIASKPRFMLDALRRLRRPIVYVDADFEVMEYPALFDNPAGTDFMVYNWYADPSNGMDQYWPDVLLCSSGVMYWNHTPGALRLLKEWCAMASANPGCADDQILDRVFNGGHHVRRMSCRWLPRSYLRIAPYFPETTPVLNHADRPGGNGPPPQDVRSARHPFRLLVVRYAHRWAGRVTRALGRGPTA